MRRVHLVALALFAAPVLYLGCDDSSDTSSTGTTSSSASSGSSGTQAGSTSSGGGAGSTSASSSTGEGGGTPSTYDCSAPAGAPAGLKLTTVASSLNSPILVKSAPDDPDRLYIVQQNGRIRILENGNVLPTLFLDIQSLLVSGGEQGLLGLAFHPDYATNGRFFVHYSATGDGDSTVREFKRSAADPLVADPMPGAIILEHPTAQSNHNGGSIEFGPDGFLYVALGDGGSQDDPECDAQNPANLFGKISRLDVDAALTPNGAPAAPGNPNGAKQFHIGFRNPWRMSFDACTGDLYVADVGQNTYEEVSVAPGAMPIVAQNMGWPYREGAHNHGAGACAPNPGNLNEPIAEYTHADGCSITGGYVYRGAKIPWLRGAYFYGDYCDQTVWRVRYANGTADAPVEVFSNVGDGNISSFGQDGRGEVYIVRHNGSVQRIDPE